MERVPTAILMSGTGSNARKLIEYRSPCLDIRLILSDNPASNSAWIAGEHGIAHRLNDITRFFGPPAPPGGGANEQRRRFQDRGLREAFDRETDRLLSSFGIRLVAAAGYAWVLSPFICRRYLMVNVHPGDLRVRDERGRRKYVGLGWIPSAKAILSGEREAFSTTHLITEELDGGPLARVSRPVPLELPPGVTRENILPPGVSLGEVIRDLNRDGGRLYGGSPIVAVARRVQERLKEIGDWVEFPLTLHRAAALMLAGRLGLDAQGRPQLDGGPVEDLFLQREEA